jgi:hypothetical protein
MPAGMQRRGARLAATAALGFALTAAGSARSQDISPTEHLAARTEFDAGVAAAYGERWDEALRRFERAYELYPSPIVLFNLAGAQIRTGHIVAGVESYQRFLHDATSGPEVRHRAAAEAASAAASQRIAHLHVSVEPMQPRDGLEIDTRVFRHAAIGADLPLDPGPHSVAVIRDGTAVGRERLRLSEGESRSITIHVAPTHTTLVVTPSTQQSAARPRSRLGVVASPWFWTGVGVLVLAGAAIGVYFAVANAANEQPYVGTFSPGSAIVW